MATVTFSDALTKFSTLQWRAHPCVRMHVVSTYGRSLVSFDLSDGPETHPEYLAQSDVYFKRGYVSEQIESLPAEQRRKILPMDLHYACQSSEEGYIDLARKLVAHSTITGKLSSAPLRTLSQIAKQTWQHRYALAGSPRETQSILASTYESTPERLVKHQIFFRTRVYSPQEARGAADDGSLEKINNMRADLVRALRRAFGNQFVGGLRASEHAKQNYPDCLDDSAAGYVGHIEATKTHLINVTTSGLHGSTGWKLPEFVAASSCIVSEHLHQVSANPLVEGENYLGFDSPEGCVQACSRILKDLDLAQSMRVANRRYHQKYLRPDQFMLNRLLAVQALRDLEGSDHSQDHNVAMGATA